MLANDTQQLTRGLVTGLMPVQPLPGPWDTGRRVVRHFLAGGLRDRVRRGVDDRGGCACRSPHRGSATGGARHRFHGGGSGLCHDGARYRRWIVVLPLVPLAAWLGDLGQSCLQDALASGPSSSSLVEHWGCVPATMLFGAIPASAS